MLGNGESMKPDRMDRCKMISRQDDSETFNIMGNMELTTIHTDNKRVYVGKWDLKANENNLTFIATGLIERHPSGDGL